MLSVFARAQFSKTPTLTTTSSPTPTGTFVELTPTPTSTSTLSPTFVVYLPATPTITPTGTTTLTSTPTLTPTSTPTLTPTSTPTLTHTSTSTLTHTSTPTLTHTSTTTLTHTSTSTLTHTSTSTLTHTSTTTLTHTSTSTLTHTSTSTLTHTSTSTLTHTSTTTLTHTSTPTLTHTSTTTLTHTSTSTLTHTSTTTLTHTSTSTLTHTSTTTLTHTSTSTLTHTSTSTLTHTSTSTLTHTSTTTLTHTSTSTLTHTSTATTTITPTCGFGYCAEYVSCDPSSFLDCEARTDCPDNFPPQSIYVAYEGSPHQILKSSPWCLNLVNDQVPVINCSGDSAESCSSNADANLRFRDKDAYDSFLVINDEIFDSSFEDCEDCCGCHSIVPTPTVTVTIVPTPVFGELYISCGQAQSLPNLSISIIDCNTNNFNELSYEVSVTNTNSFKVYLDYAYNSIFQIDSENLQDLIEITANSTIVFEIPASQSNLSFKTIAQKSLGGTSSVVSDVIYDCDICNYAPTNTSTSTTNSDVMHKNYLYGFYQNGQTLIENGLVRVKDQNNNTVGSFTTNSQKPYNFNVEFDYKLGEVYSLEVTHENFNKTTITGITFSNSCESQLINIPTLVSKVSLATPTSTINLTLENFSHDYGSVSNYIIGDDPYPPQANEVSCNGVVSNFAYSLIDISRNFINSIYSTRYSYLASYTCDAYTPTTTISSTNTQTKTSTPTISATYHQLTPTTTSTNTVTPTYIVFVAQEPTPTTTFTEIGTPTPTPTPTPTLSSTATITPPSGCLQNAIIAGAAIGHADATNTTSAFYTFNDSIKYPFYLNIGTYTLTQVPYDHPILLTDITDSSKISISGLDARSRQGHYGKGYTSGVYGNQPVTITVSGDFGSASYQCAFHGYMGGQNNLIFNSNCV